MAKYKSLAFEFRPWGSNQHFGKYGCLSCTPDRWVSQTVAKQLPFMTLLHYAAEIAHWPLMEPLVQEYCRHESADDSTLVIACRNNQLRIIKQLTQLLGFNLSNGKAVDAAAASGHADVLTFLLEEASQRNLNVVPFDTVTDGYLPLVNAAANGHEAVVDLLYSKGAKIDAVIKDRNDVSPLLAAARNGHDRVVRNLLSKGAEVLTCGTTPLHCAAENGHDVVVRTLLKNDVESKYPSLSYSQMKFKT